MKDLKTMPARKGAGRPKKVNLKDFKLIVDSYLQDCKVNQQVPFLGELASRLNIHASTLSDYQQTPEYAKLIKRVSQETENGLIRKGLNENKPVFPIFLLKAKFGYIEANKLDITSNGQTLGVVELPHR